MVIIVIFIGVFGFMFYACYAHRKSKGHKAEPFHENITPDNEMVVPIGKKVRLLATAADVIHAWFVPAFAVKQDAIPGFIRDTWFRADKEGTYRGQCAELCGKDHAFMPIVVLNGKPNSAMTESGGMNAIEFEMSVDTARP